MLQPQDIISGSQVAIGLDENRVHEFQMCYAYIQDAALADAANMDLFLEVPSDKDVHIRFFLFLDGNGEFTVLEDTGAGTLNTAVPTYTHHGLIVATAAIDTKFYSAEGGAATWTERFAEYIGGGAGQAQFKSGGEGGNFQELIFEQHGSKRWKFTLSNNSGSASRAQILLDFYTMPRDSGADGLAPTVNHKLG
jgi:hypothetical protein